MGVLQSFVDHADAVLQRRLAQQQHDHPRPQGRRRIANDFLRRVDGRRYGSVRGVHLLGRAGGHRLGMALELLPEGRRAPRRKRLRHPGVEFVRGVLRVRAGGGVFAAGVERVADQQVAAHQAQLQQIVGVRQHRCRHGERLGGAARKRRRGENDQPGAHLSPPRAVEDLHGRRLIGA